MRFIKSILLRARIVLLIVLGMTGCIVCRILHIQVIEGNKWRTYARQTQLEYKPILASRGNIYAENGVLLATSLPFYSLAIDPTVATDEVFFQNIKPLSHKLAAFFGDYSPQHYYFKIVNARKKNQKYISLNNRYICHTDKKELYNWPLFNQGRYKGGVIFQEQYKRYYPFQELAKRTLGMQKGTYGFGLEHTFNTTLKGIDGSALYQKIVGGNWKLVHKSTAKPPIHGYDLETTLDINLQDIAHHSLLDVLKKHQAKSGCVIVMEVNTGAIKAMVNLCKTSDDTYSESYNYAIGNQGLIEPGSTFKLVSMLALLEEKHYPLTQPIDTGNGLFKFCNSYMRDVKSGGYGIISLQEVFEKSSNIGISKLVQQTFGKEPKKFISYIERLELHKKIGFELIGEGNPYIITPTNKMWNKITLPWLAIGYNIQITPLHMLMVYNAIANQGKMVKPFLVRKIKSASGIIKNFKTVVIKEQICSTQTLKKLQAMLQGTVEKGTAQTIKHSFYKIAGKTGTTKKLVNGKYVHQYLTSFVGYFPADKPRYSCIIIVDDPQSNGTRFGAEVSAPVFKDIVDRIAGKDIQAREPINGYKTLTNQPIHLKNSGFSKELAYLYQSLNLPIPQNMACTELCSCIQQWPTQPSIQPHTLPFLELEQVPCVLNMKLKDALFLLEKNGLNVNIMGNIHGTVQKQSLKPNHKMPSDKQITIILK